MKPELWKKVQSVLGQVLDMDPAQRDARIVELCDGEELVEQEIRVLLAADDNAADIFQSIELPDGENSTQVMAISAEAKKFEGFSELKKIGAGGMGVIYKAKDLRLGREVALKFLSPQLSGNEECRQRFLTEAKAISKIDHPNVCMILEFGEFDDGQLYFTMPFYQGKTLKEHIDEDPLNVSKAIDIIIQVASALQAAHSHDVVHRDMKPANVLINRENVVKVLDFGIAKVPDSELTQTGQTIGTVAYMSPEQIKSEHVDHRTDIWSIGVMFYELLVTKLPFRGKNSLAISNAIIAGSYPPISDSFFKVPALLDRIMSLTLATDPNKRYQDISELMVDLEELQTEIDDTTQRVPIDTGAQNNMLEQTTDSNSVSESMRIITHEFTKWVGPSARIIINTWSNETDTIEELCLRLANELPSEEERRAFLDSISAVSHISNSSSLQFNLAITGNDAEPINNTLFNQNGRPVKAKKSTWIALWVTTSAVIMVIAAAMNSTVYYGVEDAIESVVDGSDSVRGVTSDEIRIGMTAAFSGVARELGRSMQLGVEARFKEENAIGGVHGRMIRLVAMDDHYEPRQAIENLTRLLNVDEGVFAVLGNVGTPTANVILPEILRSKTLLFGTFSGAQLLRANPPDRYVFNYRASYAEETAALVDYFVGEEEVDPKKIAVFHQNDSYGEDGLKGVVHALHHYGVHAPPPTTTYERNTAKIDPAVEAFDAIKDEIDAIIIIGTYQASALFTKALKKRGFSGKFANVSFVGSSALAEKFMELGIEYGEGVLVSQVVPFYDSFASGVLRYRMALAQYYPNELPNFISLEGYIVASIFLEALERNGRKLDTESLVTTLQSIRSLDLGIGPTVSFGPSMHQASHYVWGSRITANGQFEHIDLTHGLTRGNSRENR